MADEPREPTESEVPPAPRPDPFLSGPAAGDSPFGTGAWPASADGPGASLSNPSAARADNKLAPLALASALASFVCLPAVGGLLAIGLGVAARSEMRRLPNRQGGGLALAAILLGGVNLLVSAVAAALLFLWVGEMNAPWRDAPPMASLTAPAPPAAPPRPVDRAVDVSTVGEVLLVDIEPHVPSLSSELERQQKAAAEDDARVVLWLVGPRCLPCDGVESALADPVMQEALRGVRLVRLNAADFQVELARLHMPTHAIPAFALLGSTGRPIDYIHGGEWDEDIADNIAPVLGKFVRGEYRDRRYPWRGGVRDDETAL